MRSRNDLDVASRRSMPPNRTEPLRGSYCAREQLRERRLTGAGRADERKVLALPDRQRHAVDGRRPAVVGEMTPVDLEVTRVRQRALAAAPR